MIPAPVLPIPPIIHAPTSTFPHQAQAPFALSIILFSHPFGVATGITDPPRAGRVNWSESRAFTSAYSSRRNLSRTRWSTGMN